MIKIRNYILKKGSSKKMRSHWKSQSPERCGGRPGYLVWWGTRAELGMYVNVNLTPKDPYKWPKSSKSIVLFT